MHTGFAINRLRSAPDTRPTRRWRGATRRAIAVGWLVAGCLAGAAIVEAGSSGKPKVPAGLDPGGVAVALIGPGIDYRTPEIYRRLARDGEGDLIGWDFVDNDLKPFAPDADCPVQPQPCVAADGREAASPARLLLAEAAASKLIALRTKDGDRGTLAAAIAFAARSPARIVPTLARRSVSHDMAFGPDWQLMIEAARRFSNLLFIVPAYGPPIDVPGFDKLSIGNLLIVTPVTTAGEAGDGETPETRPEADIAVGDSATAEWAGSRTLQDRAERAVARVSALAARLSAVDPILDAHGMKQRILQLARPLPTASAGLARAGWLPDPRRHVLAD